MYFIKSGECRVVMHVATPGDASPRSLPRAASSLCQYRPTTHDHCKQKVKELQKHWGHPHFMTRPLSCPTSRSQSVPPISFSPPVIYEYESSNMASTKPVAVTVQGRPSSAPEARVTFKDTSTESKLLSAPRDFDESSRREATPGQDVVRRSVSAQGHQRQSRLKSEKQQMHPRQKKALPFLPSTIKQSYLEQEQENAQQTSGRLKSIRFSRKSRPLSQMSLRSYKSRKGSKEGQTNTEYSLESLLKEINHKFSDESIQDLEFSDKEAMLWGMGTADTGLLRGDVSDPMNYQNKFEVWVRTVISREKKLRAIEENSEDGLSTSFRSSEDTGTETEIDKLFKTGTILDVGGLHAGEYFGEAGLLSKATRAASILSVTDVEVLVLTNSDFSRRLDQDIIDCLCAANYKKASFMLEQFYKTHRWELVKKRVMKDALMGKKERFPNRFYHDMSDAIRRKGMRIE
ncbi:uncharacterized protein LOC112345345 isoform X1 [Selaginella moellendorffii]|uniref:uncharacterized protein LOC112345345 isoform X1 n=2 Tax=Selaginella moellendorffii TaxID=88036 RepID=UPI000D1C7C3D|nr:uncharacterized protein LOC112345345 isoform X1 [Selaginella moellendorffii]|eukprot:XP_024527594.1 uncharacterized protein LOC112345345 isoform X1 [Selaginella moellendorffii]